MKYYKETVSTLTENTMVTGEQISEGIRLTMAALSRERNKHELELLYGMRVVENKYIPDGKVLLLGRESIAMADLETGEVSVWLSTQPSHCGKMYREAKE